MIDPQRPDYSDTPASERRSSFAYALADARVEPVVSIVTPFFNTGALFHETARSVFRQSLQQWEWLIVNDASTDPVALEVLDHYRHRDDRIRVIDLATNGGPSRARNVAYAAARTPFALQLDSDNLLEPTAAEKWWWFLQSHPRAAFVKGFSVGFGAQTYLWRDGFHNPAAFLTSNPVDVTSMVRVAAHRRAGGYDETMRDGLEDWDFWMRCAAAGEWGATVPEFLDWYRRRPNHNDRWSEWDGGARQTSFVAGLRDRYPAVTAGRFPDVTDDPPSNATLSFDVPAVNQLRKPAGPKGSASPGSGRLLLIVPWFAMGGSDKFNLDLVEMLAGRGWDVTIAATRNDPAWLSHFTRWTPDVFSLPVFLRPVDYPRFLLYLLRSRQVDVVMVAHAELGYHLLPFLRSHAPDVTFVDYLHIVEESWHDGGYPRLSIHYRNFLDLSIVSSHHLEQWLRTEGAEPDRVQVCYTGGRVVADEDLRNDRERVRQELGVSADEPLILYPARLCPQKQPKVFAGAVQLLADQGARFTCLVAGDGPDRAWLGACLKRHRLTERVRMLGPVSPARMRELMGASDICFLPSTHEGVALTLYEAMSHGCVFVGADVGGQSEVAPEPFGILLPRLRDADHEAAAYAVAISQLLNDRSGRQGMGEAARQRIADSFSLERMVETMEQAFATAGRLRRERPRAPLSHDVGQLLATRAIEHERVARLAESLWTRQAGMPPLDGGGWRLWLFRMCTHLEPAYAWGLRRGWRWLPAARERIRASLAS
jgi:glycosyltransferase involved in cell wall biosynthesis